MVEFVDESSHLAPFLHGLLWHSSTSRAQLPLSVLPALVLSVTEHCALYCAMKLYTHVPSAKPAAQVHR